MQNLGLFQITLAGAEGFLALCPPLSGRRTEFKTLFGSEIVSGLNRAKRTSDRSNRARLSIMNTALAELRHAEIACDLIEERISADGIGMPSRRRVSRVAWLRSPGTEIRFTPGIRSEY
jgi:hypothetical protein